MDPRNDGILSVSHNLSALMDPRNDGILSDYQSVIIDLH